MSDNLYHWRKKKKAWNPYCLRSFITRLWLKGKGHHSNVGRVTGTESAGLPWHPWAHTTQGGLKALTLKRVEATASSRLLLNVPKHLAAVPELNCVYVCTCKVKLVSNSCFPHSSGDKGVGVMTAVTRHWVAAIQHGRGCHSSWVTLWCRDHYHLRSVCAFVHVTPDVGTAGVFSINTGYPALNHSLQSSEVTLLTGNSQGLLFFYMCPLGPQNINAGKSCFWTCL